MIAQKTRRFLVMCRADYFDLFRWEN